MKEPQSVNSLEMFGRVQLSPSFYMRDFLYSEISQIEGIPNIPDDPDLAIAAGKKLCETVLEPIQDQFGPIAIRSAYRSCAVNAKGNEKKYRCASNESNYAAHIWDRRDNEGFMGAMACIVVTRFVPYYEKTKKWQALAWWIHDNIPAYSSMCFFPKLAAFNIGWHERQTKSIQSYIKPDDRFLTKPGMNNQESDHLDAYQEMLDYMRIFCETDICTDSKRD